MNKIEAMSKAGSIGDTIFRRFQFILEPGLPTKELDKLAAKVMKFNDCIASFKGYGPDPFPASICVSINEEICHGIPSEREIGGGDLVSIDMGIQYEGFIIDACRTFAIGEISDEADHLNYWTKTALKRALRHIKAGVCWQNIAAIMQNTAKKKDLHVVKEMTGHGVGAKLHEEPTLRNYMCAANEKIILKEGQTIAVEPMFAVGSGECEIADDKWTVLTKDRSLSCHWEHTVMVTKTGCEILL